MNPIQPKFASVLCISPEANAEARKALHNAKDQGQSIEEQKQAFTRTLHARIASTGNHSENTQFISTKIVSRVTRENGKFIITKDEPFSFQGDEGKPVGATYIINDASKNGSLCGDDENDFERFVINKLASEGTPFRGTLVERKAIVREHSKQLVSAYIAEHEGKKRFMYIG